MEVTMKAKKIKQALALVLSAALLLGSVQFPSIRGDETQEESALETEDSLDKSTIALEESMDTFSSKAEDTLKESIAETETISKESSDKIQYMPENSFSDTAAITNTLNSNNVDSESAPAPLTVDTLDELIEEASAISMDEEYADNKYSTKRLIVLSDTPEFDTYNAVSNISYDDLYILSYETEKDCKNAFKKLSDDTTILSVEIDSIMETEENDTGNTDSKDTSTFEENALKKHLDTLQASKEVKVAILDTGLDTSNELFNNRVIDLGINLSSTGQENSISDDNGHGTDMAVIIANNSNEMVKILPIKVANKDGKATVLNTYLGIQKAIENDVDIINISMNTNKSNASQILTNLIDEATENGIITVVSAGNNNTDTINIAPANIDSAIVVSAIDNNNNFASYSNYGETVDYCCYGTYGDKTGTSYAAANVTSIMADILSKNESIAIIDNYLIDLGDAGKDIYYGNGLIQVGDIEEIAPQLPNETDEAENDSSNNNDDDNASDEDIHIMTKEECEQDAFWQKYHTDTVVENVLDYSTDELSVSSVETLTINPNGGSVNHIDGSYITSSTAKSLGSLIGIGETKSFSTGTQTIDFKGTYHFIVVGGAGGSATLTNSDGSTAKTASGGNGVKITSNAVSINSGTKLKFEDGATSKNVSKKVLSIGSAVNTSNHFANGGSDVYKLNGSSYNTSNWYQAVFGDGGNSSSVSFSGHKIVAAGGGGGAVLYYNISGLPNKWTSKKNLNGKSVPLNTADNTSQKSGYDYEKKYVEKYGGSFASGSGLWDKGSNQYSAGKGYKNGQFGGYGSDAVAGGSCGQNYVNGFSASYTAHTEKSSYVKMACDSKTFTVNDPTRTGYTFTGWSVAGDGVSWIDNGASTTFTKSSAGNMTITANWSINSYTVTCYDYLTDGTYLGSPGSVARNYGASISGSEWGTSSPYNNAQYTYYYHSCTTVSPVTGNCSVNRYWTRNTNTYTITCQDYLTDGTYLGSPGSTTRNYGTSISGSEWGTSSPYNNAQYTYTYSSCSTINPVTGNGTVYRYWTRSAKQYSVTCIDYLTDKTTKLGTQTAKAYNYGNIAKGSDWGTSSPYDNPPYVYTYDSCTSATVDGNKTVYRYWKKAFQQSYISIPVTIDWKDESNTLDIDYDGIPDGTRPANVTLKLMNGSTVVQTITATADTSVPSSKNTSKTEFTNIPKYDTISGKEISYTVVEETPTCLDGSLVYDVKYANSGNNWTITNKLDTLKKPNTDNFYGVTMQGTITWRDDNDKYHFRPNEVIVELYQNGALYDSQTIIDGTTSYVFTGLPKLDNNMKLYEYTIVEKDIDNYSITYKTDKKTIKETDSAGNIITTTMLYTDITNTFTPNDKTDKLSNNTLSLTPTVSNANGEIATDTDFITASVNKSENIFMTLKQMDMTWTATDAANGIYQETYSDTYSGIEFNMTLNVNKTTTMTNLLYGKYEIVVADNTSLDFKNINEIASDNAKFTIENGKYYVTFSYEFEEASEDLSINFVLDTFNGYSSSHAIKNLYKLFLKKI